MQHIIDLGPIGACKRAIAPTRHGNDILYRRKIIFSMGKGKAVSGVGIGLAVDVRHAIIIADNLHIIGAGWHVISGGRQRLPQRACTRNDTDKRQGRPQKFPHYTLPLQ